MNIGPAKQTSFIAVDIWFLSEHMVSHHIRRNVDAGLLAVVDCRLLFFGWSQLSTMADELLEILSDDESVDETIGGESPFLGLRNFTVVDDNARRQPYRKSSSWSAVVSIRYGFDSSTELKCKSFRRYSSFNELPKQLPMKLPFDFSNDTRSDPKPRYRAAFVRSRSEACESSKQAARMPVRMLSPVKRSQRDTLVLQQSPTKFSSMTRPAITLACCTLERNVSRPRRSAEERSHAERQALREASEMLSRMRMSPCVCNQ